MWNSNQIIRADEREVTSDGRNNCGSYDDETLNELLSIKNWKQLSYYHQ